VKEEKVWTAEYRSLEEARASIARWIGECNHDRPHRRVQNRTPHEAFLAFAAVLQNEALTVSGSDSLKEVEEGIWLVSFMDYDLGYVDLEERTLQPLHSPFGPKVLPM
jgi:hypothetical protein